MRILSVASAVLVLASGVACKPAPPANAAAATAPAPAAAPAAAPAVAQAANSYTGSIAETMDSGGYTYVKLKGEKDEVWVAAPTFDAKVGETVSVSLDMPMAEFQSKTLNRTFPMLYFVQEVARNGRPLTGGNAPAAPALMGSHGTAATAPVVQKLDPPAGGLSVADVIAKQADLSGKPVTVRGTVMKFNGGIMDRNWLHLQDGSGSADA
ncbi:MAG: nucleotide-binding protein [Vicinamibacterales bacterium]